MTTTSQENAVLAGQSTVPVTIRPATAMDYPVAARLFQSTMGESFTLNPTLWEEICTTQTHLALAAVEGSGEVAGIAVVVVSDRIRLAAGTHRRRFHIDELIVAPEKRRRGVGRALLEHIKELAQKQTPSYIIVNCNFTNVSARRLYEAGSLHLVRQSNDRFEIAYN